MGDLVIHNAGFPAVHCVGRLCFEKADVADGAASIDILALHESLERLAALDPQLARIVELRFFGGFSTEETAQALGISVATVGREQRLAEAWLYREMAARPSASGAGSGGEF